MSAYYNEHDPFAAQWLRNLIKASHIAPGDVDERSIEDVTPNDLKPYTQCHFFAGIGTWSYALRKAGWPDDRPVWTGSPPCQPFSDAGQRGGIADKRHLWPSFFWLISQSKPGVIFGEQVSSKDGLAWLDIVQSDLEAAGYAVGALDLCAAGVGAPHKRQRLYFVADAEGQREWKISVRQGRQDGSETANLVRGGGYGRLVDASSQGLEERRRQPGDDEPQFTAVKRTGRESGGMADAKYTERWPPTKGRINDNDGANAGRQKAAGRPGFYGPSDNFWSNAEWLPCTDGKARAVEPGTFPLVNGAAARVGRLRGYGNGIVAPLAIEFIKAYMESE